MPAQVPCGVVAAQVFKNAKVTVKPVTLEPDVKSVLTQVELGNVDAGVVYVTDVQAAGTKVKGVTIPANLNASTLYPIATISSSKAPADRSGFRRLRAVARGRAGAHGRRVRSSPELASGAVMITRPAPSRLTARERARRAARGGLRRSVPAPLLVPALIAILFLLLPLAGLLIRAPWGRLGAALSGSDATQALTLSLWTATVSTAISVVIGVPLAWVLARASFPGPASAARPGHPAARAPARGRRGRAAAGVRPDRVRRPLPGLVVRADDPVHAAGRGHGRDLRRHAVPDHHRRGSTAVRRPGLRGGSGHAGRETDDGVPPDHRCRWSLRPWGAGAVLCWARALGEFGATITFAGSFPGQTETMPIAVYYALEN